MSWIIIRHAKSFVLLLFCASAISACKGSVAQESGTVEVIAEHGVGDGHPATEVPIGRVTDVAVDTAGNIYFVDEVHLRVRRIRADGVIDTVFNSHALDAASSPRAVAVDEQRGVVYIADDRANRVWVIREGRLEVFAGTGASGLGGDGGPALEAQFRSLADLAVGPDGTLYIADLANHRIRAVTVDGRIETVAGDLSPYIDSNEALTLSSLFLPELIAAAPDGSLYVVDRHQRRLQRIMPNGPAEELSDVAGSISGVAAASDGRLMLASAGVVYELDDNGLFPFAEPRGTSFTAVAALRSDVIAYDSREHRIRRIAEDGSKVLIAGNGTAGRFGDGGPANGATFSCYDIVVGLQARLSSATLSMRGSP